MMNIQDALQIAGSLKIKDAELEQWEKDNQALSKIELRQSKAKTLKQNFIAKLALLYKEGIEKIHSKKDIFLNGIDGIDKKKSLSNNAMSSLRKVVLDNLDFVEGVRFHCGKQLTSSGNQFYTIYFRAITT